MNIMDEMKDMGEMLLLFFIAPLITIGCILLWLFWTEWLWLLF